MFKLFDLKRFLEKITNTIVWLNGSATGSVRTSGSAVEDSNYTMGQYAVAEGKDTKASGYASHAEGNCTTAQRKSQTTIGEFNVADTGGTDETTRGNYVFIIGNGTSDDDRSNAFIVDWSGKVAIANELVRKIDSDYIVDSTASSSHPASATYAGGFRVLDKNDVPLTIINTGRMTDGRARTAIQGHRNIGGTNIYNGVYFYINDSGTRTVAVADAAAWRSGLGAQGQISASNFSISNHSISWSLAASATNADKESTFTNSGYWPLALGGWNINNQNIRIGQITLYSRSVGSVTIRHTLRNLLSSSQSGTLYVQVVWVKW